jgi:hypothetical protein
MERDKDGVEKMKEDKEKYILLKVTLTEIEKSDKGSQLHFTVDKNVHVMDILPLEAAKTARILRREAERIEQDILNQILDAKE